MSKARNPKSSNQLLMKAFFGADAAKMPADHNEWPEPYASMYWRIWNSGLQIVEAAKYKEGLQAISTLNEISGSMVD